MSTPHDSVPQHSDVPPGSTQSAHAGNGSDSFEILDEMVGDEPLDQQKTVISRRPSDAPMPLSPLAAGRAFGEGRLADALQGLEHMPAFPTFIFVNWHDKNQDYC